MFIAWGTIQTKPTKRRDATSKDSMSRVHTYNIPGQPTKSGGRNYTKVLNRVQYRPPTHRRTRASLLCQRWQRGNPATAAGLCFGRTLFSSHSQSKEQRHHRHLQKLQTSPPHSTIDVVQINTRFLVQLYPNMNKHIVPSPTKLSRARASLGQGSSGYQGRKSVAGLPFIKAAFHKRFSATVGLKSTSTSTHPAALKTDEPRREIVRPLAAHQ